MTNLDFERESLNENAIAGVHNTSETETKNVDETCETNNKTEQDQDTWQVITTNKTHFESADYMNFVIGDSNAIRIHVKDPDVKNVSKSGQKAKDIKSLLDDAASQASSNKKTVKRIVLHLGTNDVSKH